LQEVKLKDLRDKYPTCVLKKADINNVELGKYVSVLVGVSLQNCSISDHSYISVNSKISNCAIGKYCSIGPNVIIGLGPHPARGFVSTHPVFYSNNNEGCACFFRNDKIFNDKIPKTIIKNDVWVGANVIIPGNITIETGAIVATGTVVTKDVPPYAIVGGNPAKIIRYRFSKDQVNVLIDSKWWNWSKEKIAECIDSFADIRLFRTSLHERKN
jgi:acetyltransferase-like isoleucine patch superfamily enzyme